MDVENPVTYEYIDTTTSLIAASKELSKARRIAVDLEADSMYHFQEKVCLLQMAANGSNFVVDPLLVPDLSPLQPLFSDDGIQKIFHGADYDVRSLYRDFGIEIHNLFDTELASRFLGVSGTGLEAVVKKHLGIVLDKKYQKKDWSLRPLPLDMIDYAARDVAYLLPISDNLIGDLKQKSRLGWVLEECELLSGVRPVSGNQSPLFLKVKGAGRLRPRSLAVLEKILQFRRKIAQKKDRPLFKVFSNRVALALAVAMPLSSKALTETHILSHNQLMMYGRGIVAGIKAAAKLPGDKLPAYPKNRAPRPPARAAPRIKALQQWRNNKAEALGMDAGLICNRNLAARLATENPDSIEAMSSIEEMKAWQISAFGKEIVCVLGAVGNQN